MMAKNSIQFQVTKRSLFGTFSFLIVIALLADLLIVRWLEQQFDEALHAKASLLVTLVKELEDGVDFDFAGEFLPEFEREVSPEYFQLWQEGTGVFERSDSTELVSKGDLIDLPKLPINENKAQFSDATLPDGRDGRYVQITFFPQIPDHERRVPSVLSQQKLMTLVVFKEIESLNSMLWKLNLIMFMAFLLIMILMGFVIWFSTKNGLIPLEIMRGKINNLSAQNLSERLDLVDPPLELNALIKAYNAMLERVENGYQRERQFSSDVAHELRTPIAELRSIAEVSKRWPDDIALKEKLLEFSIDASQHMQNLVNNLLILSRCEQNQVDLNKAEVDLNALIKKVWARYKCKYEAKSISLSINHQDQVAVQTSELELDQVLSNLLSNAVEYSRPGTNIEVTFSQLNNMGRLIISNIPSNLSKEDLPVMMDRLWRKDQSRTSSEHSGLGLPLTKTYLELLGMSIAVSLDDAPTFSVTISGFELSTKNK